MLNTIIAQDFKTRYTIINGYHADLSGVSPENMPLVLRGLFRWLGGSHMDKPAMRAGAPCKFLFFERERRHLCIPYDGKDYEFMGKEQMIFPLIWEDPKDNISPTNFKVGDPIIRESPSVFKTPSGVSLIPDGEFFTPWKIMERNEISYYTVGDVFYEDTPQAHTWRWWRIERHLNCASLHVGFGGSEVELDLPLTGVDDALRYIHLHPVEVVDAIKAHEFSWAGYHKVVSLSII